MKSDDTTRSYNEQQLRKRYDEERAKRLRNDGEAQFIEATGDYAEFTDDPYIDQALERGRIAEDVDVVIVGGGFGGLLTAAGLRKRGIDSFRIIEQAADFGGTWYWNRYPGVRCDIESLIYMPLLEEVGTVPTKHYASGGEIFEHCKAIGRHFDLYEQALFQTKVTRIAWSDDLARWIVETDRGDTLHARHVTVSQGPLAKVKLPGIPGIRTFEGRMFHTSRWEYDYTGGDESGALTKLGTERVAVIGTGATAVQIIPHLARHAKKLYVFQRTPSGVDIRGNRPIDPEWYRSLPKGWQQERMDNFLSILSMKPQAQDMVHDQWTDYWKRIVSTMKDRHESGGDTDPHHVMQHVDYQKMEELRARIGDVVADPATAEAMTPWYNYLCKRPLFSDNFLEAFNEPNVELVDTDGRGVEKISKNSLIANGTSYEVDCIIFATGFDVGAAAHKVGGYELRGRSGQSIDDKWSNGMRTLHGTQMHGFPNFHIVGGVAQGTTAFNFTHILAMQADHAVDLISRCVDKGVAVMEVTADAETRWLRAMKENQNAAIEDYFAECTPGFLNNEGSRDQPSFLGSAFGGGSLAYNELICDWRENRVADDTKLTFEEDLLEKRDAS